jgi:diguanylate cyclase (GGDEF)-like protein/PAS domain S-box-containing protein
MNPVAERMTGWRLDATVGHSLSEIFIIATNENADLRRSSGAPDPTFGIPDGGKDALLFGRDGGRRDIHYTSSPVRATDGEIVGIVLVFQDVTQNRELQRKLAHSASHDALTGLPNWSAFEHTLALAVETARSGGRNHVLGMMDLDKFKAVNDAAGHAAGDALLKQVAEAIRRTVRPPDFAGRIGGDEFAIVLHDCDLEQAELVSLKLSAAVADIDFHWNGQSFTIGASLGLTAIDQDSVRPIDLKEEADIACYAAKGAGGGGVTVHHR